MGSNPLREYCITKDASCLLHLFMFYASLSGTSIDYSCGTLEGPFDNHDDAQDFCDMKNAMLIERGIPSDAACWHIE